VNFEQIDFLSEKSAQFRYNEKDQMYYAKVGDDAVYIEYDASGYRYVKQSSSFGIEYYIYDRNGRLQAIADLAEVIVNGTTKSVMYPVKQYIWGPDRVLAQVDIETDGIYYYLYNGHGDVVQIVDRNGNIKNRYDYDVWGNFLKKEETIDNHFTYFGQTYDDETGLYYLRARYYDPTTGRFTQQDPAEDGYNWYVYGNQNPVVYADYTGEEPITLTAGAVAIIKFAIGAIVAVGATYTLNRIVKNISDNRKHHILHGSNNKHEDGWRKFNIDPDDPNGFEKLLPIINEVIKKGTKSNWREVDGGRCIRTIEYYFSKIGETVIVIINKTADGIETITDAYTKYK